MFYKKSDFPEEGEIVLCTVKSIVHDTVFVILDEYKDKEGIIHISEIAPGRVRTIRDYVKEGKKIICKTLRVNKERSHIDISLRRVTSSARSEKNEFLKQEETAEKILEIVGKNLKLDLKSMYEKVGYKIIEEFGSLIGCFKHIIEEDENAILNLGVDKKIGSELTLLIKQRIKPPEVKITKTISLRNPAPNGIEIIKSVLKKAKDLAKAKKLEVDFHYLGAPRFMISLKSRDYKTGNPVMEEIINLLITTMKKEGGEAEISK